MTWRNWKAKQCNGKLIGLLLSACAAAGCGTTKPPTPTRLNAPVAVANNPQPIPNNAIQAMDPCGDRMQDLCGALLSYYLVRHRGPARLEDLQQFADVGEDLKFTCPVSGKPYVYVAEGLEATGQDIRIFIHDPTPAHHGARWCAVMKASTTPGAAEVAYAVQLPEADFKRFSKASLQLPVR